MSNRYEHLHYCEYRDTETGLVASNYVEVMNEQDQKIKDLEHRLSNCVEPKYKAGQEVWHLLCENGVAKDVIEENYNVYSLKISRFGGLYEDLLFATEAEAKAKLRSLKDGCDRT